MPGRETLFCSSNLWCYTGGNRPKTLSLLSMLALALQHPQRHQDGHFLDCFHSVDSFQRQAAENPVVFRKVFLPAFPQYEDHACAHRVRFTRVPRKMLHLSVRPEPDLASRLLNALTQIHFFE